MGFDLWVTRMRAVVSGVPVGAAIWVALGCTAKAWLISLVEAATNAGMLVLIVMW